MNRPIWLLLSPLLVLTGMTARGDVINFRDLSGGVCTTAPDPATPGAEFGSPAGCWNLQNRNSDDTTGGYATGTGMMGLYDATVKGSDANFFDFSGNIGGPMMDEFGTPISTLTQFTTVISAATPGITLGLDDTTLSGDLTFNWRFTTADAGSFYDPAGYILCPASPTGFPSQACGLYQLTADMDAVNAPDPLNPDSPFPESGTVTVTLAPGDVFGGYVLTADNVGGAGTIVFSDASPLAAVPEPATLLLIGGGLLALGGMGRKARREQA
jgi:hypothetical protein